jgi:hypothetical protein
MRTGLWVGAVVLAAAWARPADAQLLPRWGATGSRASGLPGGAGSPSIINVAPNPFQSSMPVQRTGISAGTFTNLFRSNATTPGFPPKQGISPLPAPMSFPSTWYQPFQAVPFTPANNIGMYNGGRYWWWPF